MLSMFVMGLLKSLLQACNDEYYVIDEVPFCIQVSSINEHSRLDAEADEHYSHHRVLARICTSHYKQHQFCDDTIIRIN